MAVMAALLPLALPAAVVGEHRVDLTAKPAEGWAFTTYDVTANAAGEIYALCGAVRYRPQAVASSDPCRLNFTYHLITRFAPEGTPTATALLGGPAPGNAPVSPRGRT